MGGRADLSPGVHSGEGGGTRGEGPDPQTQVLTERGRGREEWGGGRSGEEGGVGRRKEETLARERVPAGGEATLGPLEQHK